MAVLSHPEEEFQMFMGGKLSAPYTHPQKKIKIKKTKALTP